MNMPSSLSQALTSPQRDTDTVLLAMPLSPLASIPTQATNNPAALNLFPASEGFILPRDQTLVPTDLAFLLPEGTYGRVTSHPDIAREHHAHVTAGIIDPAYQGNTHILVANMGATPFHYSLETALAQMILEYFCSPKVVETTSLSINTITPPSNPPPTKAPPPSPVSVPKRHTITHILFAWAPHAGKTTLVNFLQEHAPSNITILVAHEAATHVLRLLPSSGKHTTTPFPSHVTQDLITIQQRNSGRMIEDIAWHAAVHQPVWILFNQSIPDAYAFLPDSQAHQRIKTWNSLLYRTECALDIDTLRLREFQPFDSIIHLMSTAHHPHLPYEQCTHETQTTRPHDREQAAAVEDILVDVYAPLDARRYIVQPLPSIQAKIAQVSAYLNGKFTAQTEEQ
eukprot:3362527-Rhodomonas_salina.1